MQFLWLIIVVLGTNLALHGQSSESVEKNTARPAGFAAVSRVLAPSVVTIRAYLRDPSATPPETIENGWVESPFNEEYPGFRLHSAGSGLFVSKEGEILTCYNFLRRTDGSPVDLIVVETFEQKMVISELISAEPTVNLAILRLKVFNEGFPPNFQAAELGDSASMESGDFALVMGDPAGPEKFFGIGAFCAGPCRDCYQDLLTSFYLQVAITVHPEVYGGPVMDAQGRVLGLLCPRDPKPGPHMTKIPHGIEFALPANVIAGLYKTMKQNPTFRSPWLGFSVMSRPELIKARGMDTFNAMTKPPFGIYIENVFTPSPATRAGIKPGDFLVSFNNQPIYTPIDFQKQLYLAGIGSKVRVEMFRDGASTPLDLVIEERPPNAIQR